MSNTRLRKQNSLKVRSIVKHIISVYMESKPREYDVRKFGLRKLSQCYKSMKA